MPLVEIKQSSNEAVNVNPPPLIWFEGDFFSALSLFHIYISLKELAPTPSKEADQTDSSVAAVERHFLKMVSGISAIERILIRKDADYLRIWMVMEEPDLDVEDEIYQAQLEFMDKFSEIPTDFSVIFRQGRDPREINITSARILFPD